MERDASEKDTINKKKPSESLTESLTEDLWSEEEPENELEEYNQQNYNKVSDQHIENASKDNGEEKPPVEKKLRTIIHSETKKVNGKEEAIFDEKFLQEIANQSKKIDLLNGIDFTEYVVTTKQDLSKMQIDPISDLVYEISDDEVYTGVTGNSPKFGDTYDNPRSMNGINEEVIHGNINVGTHIKEGVKNENLAINLGRTLAHERLAHGYNNILNNLTGKTDLGDHTHGGFLTDEGNDPKKEIIHTPTTKYKKLRSNDTIQDQTRVNVKSLHNFVNKGEKFFSPNLLQKKLNTYKYTKDNHQYKDRLFSILVDNYLSGVKKAK